MKKHYFKDKVIICCKETGGEFSVNLWRDEKYPKNYCLCCKKQINPNELKK